MAKSYGINGKGYTKQQREKLLGWELQRAWEHLQEHGSLPTYCRHTLLQVEAWAAANVEDAEEHESVCSECQAECVPEDLFEGVCPECVEKAANVEEKAVEEKAAEKAKREALRTLF